MDASHIPWLTASVLGALAAVQTARLWWRGAVRRLRARGRARRALRGERDAERLLRRLGYRVVERQARRPWRYELDGTPRQVEVRADLIVSRGARRLVAEVKTGERAPRLDRPRTRRQLLEYRFAFDVDGVLLVEPEAGRAREVRFPASAAGSRQPAAPWITLLLGIVTGALAAWHVLGP